jgi:hypothetical protein
MKKLIVLLVLCIIVLVGCPTPEDGTDGTDGDDGKTKTFTVTITKTPKLKTVEVYNGTCVKTFQDIDLSFIKFDQYITLNIYVNNECFKYKYNGVIYYKYITDYEFITIKFKLGDTVSWRTCNDSKSIKIDVNHY